MKTKYLWLNSFFTILTFSSVIAGILVLFYFNFNSRMVQEIVYIPFALAANIFAYIAHKFYPNFYSKKTLISYAIVTIGIFAGFLLN
ncbi:putative membrane-anchored protein [Elusimicrobium simillimum]